MKITDVTAVGRNAVFLLRERANILFEAGMGYAAGPMAEEIERELGGEELDAVFLSHSHYDHVAGLPEIRRRWPKVKVYASARAREILTRPTALDTIRRLSGEAAEASGLSWDQDYKDEELRIDVGLSDGETVSVKGDQVFAFSTIGHTRDSMSYVVNGEVMLCSETVGVMSRDKEYMPSFLVDYLGVEEAIERSGRIPVKEILLNHYGLVSEEDRPGIWDFLLRTARKARDTMIQVMNETETDQECLKRLEQIYHSKVDKKMQPDEAFYINAASMMKTLRRQYPERMEKKRQD